MAIEKKLAELIVARTQNEFSSRLWPQGPSFGELLDRFVEANVMAAELDAWEPMGDLAVQEIIVMYFYGAALRLADLLRAHDRIALLALMNATPILFPKVDPNVILQTISNLETPASDSPKGDPASFLFKSGVNAIDQWLSEGIETDPPAGSFKKFKYLFDRKWAARSKKSYFDQTAQADNTVFDIREIEWQQLHEQSDRLFRDGVDAYEHATELLEKAIRLAEQIFGPADHRVAKSLEALAIIKNGRGKTDEAERLYRRALSILQNARVPDDELTGCLLGLVNAHESRGQYSLAESLLKRLIAHYEAKLGSDKTLNDFVTSAFLKPYRRRLESVQQATTVPDQDGRPNQ